jgi:two-component system, OmpR family, phosphate regulon sensor histidine kinase PhoR
MLWPIIALAAVAGAAALHLYWRARFQASKQDWQRRLADLQRVQERAASTVNTRQQALFDSMAEGLVLLDHDNRIELANRAFMNLFGVTADLRTRTILEALRLHELADLVEFLGSQKQVLGYELRLQRPREQWLEINGAALFDDQGRRTGTILVFHDLTRIKQLERTRQEFVANVSHELRTPLSLIKGYVETLLDGAKDNPEVASKFLETINRNAERLKLLMDDLLTISELESGRTKLELQPVSLKAVIQKVLTDFKSRADARQVQLVNGVPELQVLAQPDRLEQVLGNLVDNAIKYGRPRGTVTIAACPTDLGQVQISVQDDGPGIPPEAIERVFERFYRVDKARSREQGGTGLGLSIVKHIVQTHGGRVWVSSELGKGATFYFTLPHAPELKKSENRNPKSE